MSPRDKHLYHQIHPLKIVTDAGSAFGSLYPLWHHHLALALLIMMVPPPVVSLLLMRFAELEPYRQSALGRYIAHPMSHAMELTRLAGMTFVAFGAWYQLLWAIAGGCGLILFAWLRGTFRST